MKQTAYFIRTPRLSMRCYELGDVAALSAAIASNLEHLRTWLPWAHNEPADELTRVAFVRNARAAFDRDEHFLYLLFDRDETLVGSVGLHDRIGADGLEIGYWLSARHGGRGYMTEAVGALTRVAFELRECDRVEIHCAPLNVRSAAIAERLGFIHDGTLRRRFRLHDGTRRDVMIWSLFADELAASAAGRVDYEARDARGSVLRLSSVSANGSGSTDVTR